MALKAASTAYLYRQHPPCPPWIWNPSFEANPTAVLGREGAHLQRPSCQHRQEPNNPRARHLDQTQHQKIHTYPATACPRPPAICRSSPTL